MLFEQRFWAPIAAGTVTATYRRWRRRQVVAGHRYRTPAGRIEVESVTVVEPTAIDDAAAAHAGYPSRDALLADLRGDPGLPLYEVRFGPVAGPDPRAELAADAQLSDADIAHIGRRLDRLDRASSHGPWTATTLSLIADQPGVRAGDLAEAVGRERLAFKVDVRKLKNLGLTLSLKVGYRLSPRGEAYLRARRSAVDRADGGFTGQK
jgi:hypothetical protein